MSAVKCNNFVFLLINQLEYLSMCSNILYKNIIFIYIKYNDFIRANYNGFNSIIIMELASSINYKLS